MILRTVRVDLSVDAELDDARSEWPRVDDAWSMIEWVLSRDPTVGEPQTEHVEIYRCHVCRQWHIGSTFDFH